MAVVGRVVFLRHRCGLERGLDRGAEGELGSAHLSGGWKLGWRASLDAKRCPAVQCRVGVCTPGSARDVTAEQPSGLNGGFSCTPAGTAWRRGLGVCVTGGAVLPAPQLAPGGGAPPQPRRGPCDERMSTGVVYVKLRNRKCKGVWRWWRRQVERCRE